MLDRLRLRRKRASVLPYGMFEAEGTAREVASARRLERIYHKGQEKVWDGRAVLAELVEKHGGVHLAPERIAPLRNLFAVILWGELAAWKVSAELALHIEPLEAKMAATSQAHDEARHFYVLHDYLALLDYTPGPLPRPASRILESILTADGLVKKLVGMQLMVEPIALTLFQMVREAEVEPVLCDLLRYFERDEARHVGLGIHYLPGLFREMGPAEKLGLWAWQLRTIEQEIRGMAVLEDDFRALGFEPREVLRLGMGKQIAAAQMLADEVGGLPIVEVFNRIADARFELQFPPPGARAGWPRRVARAGRALVRGDPAGREISPLAA